MNIAALTFNPRHDRFFIAKLLNDKIEYEKFDEYLDGKGVFIRKELEGSDSRSFWTMMKGYCPKLSKLALTFSALPGAFGVFKQKTENTKYQDKNYLKKISFIKSTL